MIIRIILIFVILTGMVSGHFAIEEGVEPPDFDTIYQDYIPEEGGTIPGPVIKGAMFVAAKIIIIGVTLSEWVYPYGLALAVIFGVFSLVSVWWIIYPVLFGYVLIDERKKSKLEKKQNEMQKST